MFNGLLPALAREEEALAWDTACPLVVDVAYSRPPAGVHAARYADRTLLEVALPDETISVAVEDVLDRGPVYVPRAGLYLEPVPLR